MCLADYMYSRMFCVCSAERFDAQLRLHKLAVISVICLMFWTFGGARDAAVTPPGS
jgi:hypothetical protein